MARTVIEVHRLHLTDVTPDPKLPWGRPTFPVFAYLVLERGEPTLIDTGVGIGNEFINALYSPVHHDLGHALGRHGVEIADVKTVLCSPGTQPASARRSSVTKGGIKMPAQPRWNGFTNSNPIG